MVTKKETKKLLKQIYAVKSSIILPSELPPKSSYHLGHGYIYSRTRKGLKYIKT